MVGVVCEENRRRSEQPLQMGVEGATVPAVFWIPTPPRMYTHTESTPKAKSAPADCLPPYKLFCAATGGQPEDKQNSEKLTFTFRGFYVCVCVCEHVCSNHATVSQLAGEAREANDKCL